VALLTAFAPHDAAADIKHTPLLDQLIKAATAEGELNVMWGGSSLGEGEGVHELEQAINREFNINIKVNYTPGPSMPQLATRIIREVQAGQKASTDLFLGIEVSLPAMIAGQVIEPVKWSDYYTEITPEMTTKGGEALLEFTLQRAAHRRQGCAAYAGRGVPARMEGQAFLDALRRGVRPAGARLWRRQDPADRQADGGMGGRSLALRRV
jgi:hypothetical protein